MIQNQNVPIVMGVKQAPERALKHLNAKRKTGCGYPPCNGVA
jgi:hypothetical protein